MEVFHVRICRHFLYHENWNNELNARCHSRQWWSTRWILITVNKVGELVPDIWKFIDGTKHANIDFCAPYINLKIDSRNSILGGILW